LENTLTEAQHAFSGINGLLADAKAGKGSLGKLMKDEELYSQILVTTKNLELLLQDIRLNPKRYTSILRKKQKEYVNPEEDPAFPNKN
jgi:phospholipid/cholesterol/gamma-HCH transport system substrate-binding protein